MRKIEAYHPGDTVHIDGAPDVHKIKRASSGGFLHVADLGPTRNPVHRSRITKAAATAEKTEPKKIVAFKQKARYEDLCA